MTKRDKKIARKEGKRRAEKKVLQVIQIDKNSYTNIIIMLKSFQRMEQEMGYKLL